MKQCGYHSGVISNEEDHKNLPVSSIFTGRQHTGRPLITPGERVALTGRTRSRGHLKNSKWR